MKKSVFQKGKHVPRYLVPSHKKRHIAHALRALEDPWRRFAEACLRNLFMHEQVFGRGPKCLACDRRFNRAEAAVTSRVEKHHACYARTCTFDLALPEDSPDIYRDPVEGEYEPVPDCRACHQQQPEEFRECLKRLYPVHAECHEDVHELERYFVGKARKRLIEHFASAANPET